MTEKNKFLVLAPSLEEAEKDFGRTFSSDEFILANSPLEALIDTLSEDIHGLLISDCEVKRLTYEKSVLNLIPIAVTIIDKGQHILWYNKQFGEWCGNPLNNTPDNVKVDNVKTDDNVVGASFYKVFDTPTILGPDYCPFHTARSTGKPTQTGLRKGKNEYYHMDVVPVVKGDNPIELEIIVIRDISDLTVNEQRFDSLLKVGAELPDLTCDILQDMSLEDRKDILRQNIIRETTELLKYQVAEVRILSEKDGELVPLLAIGMDEAAMSRKLYSSSEGNGITGYVAHTGKSYLCEDTTDDPFYIQGTSGMKSSMTVPLIHHGKVIGTFNVESPMPRAFTEVDLRFTEEFARDVAVAINTLDLLTAEKAETAAASIEAIHRAVALPIDLILNDAVHILSRNSGMKPELLEKLRQIQTNAREIKAVIQEVGRQMTPSEALPFPPENKHPLLWNANVLVVDADPGTLIAVSEMLAKFGCNVESAPCAEPAILMVENNPYDAIIAEIKLKDCSGYVFLKDLQAKMNISPVPIVFMTEFGYDPGHTIVKTRAEGVDTYLVKPFKPDRLIATLETVISRNRVDVR